METVEFTGFLPKKFEKKRNHEIPNPWGSEFLICKFFLNVCCEKKVGDQAPSDATIA